jgi:hypothetical protein
LSAVAIWLKPYPDTDRVVVDTDRGVVDTDRGVVDTDRIVVDTDRIVVEMWLKGTVVLGSK